MKIFGIIPPMVTPFDGEGQMDEQLLQEEAKRLTAAGVHGLSFAGSTGEGAVLSDEELTRGLMAIQRVNENKLPLLCGIIRNSTRQGVSAAMAAKAGGADVLMVTPTYYFGTTPEGNAAYYRAIHQATGMPIVIYNVIKTNPVLPEHLRFLTPDCGIVGIKQSVGGLHALVDMVPACEGKYRVFGAQDDAMFLSYLCGACGAISAILTLFPHECVAEWEAVQAGDIQKARSLHERMLPVWRQIEGGAFPGRLKTALRLVGVQTAGEPRAPILRTDDAQALRIEAALRAQGFIA